MTTICSRPTLEQVLALLDFLEKHPKLASGKLKGSVEARTESKKLWHQLTKILNSMPGPTRPPKSWIKFWSDKKSSVKLKVLTSGDTSTLYTNIEKRIWDSFLGDETAYHSKKKPKVEKEEPHFTDDTYMNDDDVKDNSETNDKDLNIEFDVEEHPLGDIEEQQMSLMEKVVNLMSEQTSALSEISHAVQVNAKAMERLAEASQIQARAIERIANTFDSISSATLDVRNAVVDIDLNVKRFYNTPP